MSAEGIVLVTRVSLIAYLIVVGAVFRYLVGPSKQRGMFMLAGTLGGLSSGVAVAYLISPWLNVDISAIAACVGMSLGWGVAYLFARQVPREANG
jgi:hypothetical protein